MIFGNGPPYLSKDLCHYAAAEKLRCTGNFSGIRLWLPKTKLNQILRCLKIPNLYFRVGPTLTFSPNLFLSFLFIFVLDFSLSHPKPPTLEWRERERWCSVCDCVWNERYIDWALRLPDCLPSDCFILSVKWRSRARIILLWLHVRFFAVHIVLVKLKE